MSSARAAFLDFDGVLIDSMSAHAKAWIQMLGEYGIAAEERQIYLREGEKADDTIALLLRKHNLSLSLEEQHAMVTRKRTIYQDLAPHGLKQDARQLVDALRSRDVELTIVTGSNRRNVATTLTPEERQLFRQIITADDYERGKPDPSPYLAALERSGYARDECRILENAPLGIQSGKASGIMTVAIISTLPAEYLAEADHIIESYSEFLNYI